ncbi:MAG: Tetratricopeptide 2 repeat protein [Bryobacterales bacterium]|nr:Tetratricopeptide 2 repeat protein [Bryobacterales bacterium]
MRSSRTLSECSASWNSWLSTLSSPNEPLKEMTIGAGLYASHGEFDSRITAVVRVDATRLRAKLRAYYASEGVTDPLTIDLPKGSYTPVFRDSSVPNDSRPLTPVHSAEPSIAVLPFRISILYLMTISAMVSLKRSLIRCHRCAAFVSSHVRIRV